MNQGYQKLGELLVAHHAITESQLSAALEQQSITGQRLGEILVEMGYTDERKIANCLADQYGYELVNCDDLNPTKMALECLDADRAAHHLVLPLSIDDEELFCVVADPLNVPITDDLRQQHHRNVRVAVAPASELLATIRRSYHLFEAKTTGNVYNSLPARYSGAFPRAEYDGVLILDAVDGILDRPVTLVRVPSDSEKAYAHFDLLKKTAKSTHPNVFRIYDTFPEGSYRWTVFEPIPGETLASSLRFKGKRNPSNAANLVRQTAEAAHLIGGTWICPENIWLNGNAVTFAPVVPPPDEYSLNGPVEALGTLLWQCLIGQVNGDFDFEKAAALALPSGMIVILQRCLTQRADDRFTSVEEVAQALGSFHWVTNEGEKKRTAAADREELLASLRVVTPSRRPGFWSRFFGRSAA